MLRIEYKYLDYRGSHVHLFHVQDDKDKSLGQTGAPAWGFAYLAEAEQEADKPATVTPNMAGGKLTVSDALIFTQAMLKAIEIATRLNNGEPAATIAQDIGAIVKE